MHVDAFPSRPNYGERILRVFTNVNPAASRACGAWASRSGDVAGVFAACQALRAWQAKALKRCM
jgi:hypothetical protein